MNLKIYRRIIKGLFLLLSVYAFLNLTPNKRFMLIALSTTLFITILFRTIFCGWVCPLGTIFDLIRGLGKGIGNLSFIKPINKKYKNLVKSNRVSFDKIDHYARYFRYVFFLWILQAAFLGIATIKNSDERGMVSVLYLLIAISVAGLFIERSWCKYSCPVGAVIGLFGKLSPTIVTRNEDACIQCNLCSKICPMNIDVANKKFVNNIDCDTCIKCVDACPVNDALDLKINIPLFNQQDFQKKTPRRKKKFSK